MNPPSTRVQEVPNLVFPELEAPLKDHPNSISWLQWMEEMEDALNFHLTHHDSPESRLETKIYERFSL